MAIAVEAAIRGRRIIWGAPVYDQVRVGWDEAVKAARNVADFNQTRMSARFVGGGRIIFRSLDNPDNTRGHSADGIVIDEAGDANAAAWYEVLRPMLIDTGGWAWLIGTFKGLNWFATEHANARDHTDSVAWQAPTLGVEIEGRNLIRRPHPLENPNIAFSEIENLFQTQTEAMFRQEILSEVIQGTGAVFRNIKRCLHRDTDTPGDHAGHKTVAGIDWGQVNDFTAISVACQDCKKELELDRFNKIDWHFQRDRVGALLTKWNVGNALVETNSIGGPLFDELVRDRLPVLAFVTTSESKSEIIQSLALTFEKEEMRFIDDESATQELVAYEAKRSKITGRISYNAPAGMHDDTVMARALMNRQRTTGFGVWI